MIKSRRNVFVGCHVTKPVKEALKATAKSLNISVSQYAYIAIVEKLKRGQVDPREFEEP